MQKVSLLKCEEYSNDILKTRIKESLSNIGFDLCKFNNARVALKPNLLLPAKDEKAIMTHPEFFRAVVQIIKENNGTPVLVESPAIHSLETVIKKTKYSKIVDDEKIEVANPNITKTLHYNSAKKFKHIDISSAYFDADVIIGLPKFKTHGIMYITGAVKLFFGALPGMEKSKMHFKLPSHLDFGEFLLDLYGAIKYGFEKPKTLLNIMDAILVQEGEGPGQAGKPRKMNAVIVGENAIAVDYVATSVSGLNINKVPTIINGFARNYGISSPDDIEVVGNKIKELMLSDFKPAKGDSVFSNLFRWPFNTKYVRNLLLERPVPQESKCSLCYQCKKICPASAIDVTEGKKKTPKYNYNECIRCYCCLEICPEAAIEKKKKFFSGLLGM